MEFSKSIIQVLAKKLSRFVLTRFFAAIAAAVAVAAAFADTARSSLSADVDGDGGVVEFGEF